MKIKINVYACEGVKDNQGSVIKRSMENSLKFKNIKDVKIGKYIELDLDYTDPKVAKEQADEMCKKILVNGVIEDYDIEVCPEMSWEHYLEADELLRCQGVRKAIVGVFPFTHYGTKVIESRYNARLVTFDDEKWKWMQN